eukprot:SM000004S15061  [mRNA]  locus=s4:1055275:1056427:- [translate_table: standard]
MKALQAQASERNGVAPSEAFTIDAVNLYERLGGAAPFVALSTAFYDRVFADEEAWFRAIFASSTKEEAIRNQYEFFVQRMGGPPLYTQRKGHPALIGRHGPYTVTAMAAERWLSHMTAAFDSVPEIDADSRQRMLLFFRHTAYFLVAGKELVNRERMVGYAGKHLGNA